MRTLGVAAGAAAAVLVVGLAVLLIGIRFKLGPVLDVVRRFNKRVTNPGVLRTAGSTQSRNSLIRHTGRRSGRSYDTPVGVIPTETGFLIALPYGPRADWVRNILASGSATVLTQGVSVDVDRPALVATTDVAELPQLDSPHAVMTPLREARDDAVRATREAASRGDRGNEGPALTVAQAINRALHETLTDHPEALLFGEDVARKGGVYGVTRGLAGKAGAARV
ncbi:hypothetical protein, partial [Mycolicibacterium poriferae]|uniref:hypothetical protein n=1 Tax=Mycolicibacterium poriferae TaxID=39694 RepID=UPI00321AF50A